MHKSFPFAALAFLWGACVYDADDRCNPEQLRLGEGLCVCAPDAVLTPQGCVPCGENEVAGPSGCVCAEGFSRSSETGPCAELPSGLGAECTVGGAPCPDPAYGLCVAGASGGGYCTNACSGPADCEPGYACDTAASPPHCLRPPIGAGKACTSDADCAGTEALFCESFMLHQCVVRDCSPAAQDCFPGMRCCDFTQFGVPAPICLPMGAC